MERGFDENIKMVYESGEFEYKPANWTKLQAQLQKKESRKSGMWFTSIGFISVKKMMAAAAVVTAGMLMTGIYVNQQKTQTHVAQHQPSGINQSTQTNHDTDLVKDMQKKVEVNSNTAPTLPQNQVLPTMAQRTTKNHSSPSIHLQPTTKDVANHTPVSLTTGTSIEQITHEENQIASSNAGSKDPAFTLNPDKNSAQANSLHSFPSPAFVQDNKEAFGSNSNGFSVTGSFGKGANSSMYAAGVNYQVNINQHFFVEGTLAFNSSNIQNVLSIQSTTSDIKFVSGAANGGLIPEVVMDEYPENKIKQASYSHMAFNPSIGYQLTSKLSIKAGVDVQRQLNNNSGSSFIESDEYYKPLPIIDVGFTPKIGVQLTKHWISNLIYRKAINNVFSKTDYYNRNYFQLQLGYKF